VTLPSGTTFVRVHHRRFAGDEFNVPRRLPFGPPVVGTLYAARDDATAIAEALFHDVPLAGNLPRAALNGRLLTRLRASRDLQLIELPDRALIDTPAADYVRTAKAAELLRADTPDADGITWASRRVPAGQAFVLFGDRIADLIVIGHPLALDHGSGLRLVEETAMRADVGLLL
jgi:RES domain-containing protein